MFDPYHRWLAIPPGQRPPTYYQLLGISPDEQDAEVIKEAALRQTSHVRTYQTGPYAEQCAAILNEIGQARSTLLNPDKRREYDASLSRRTPVPPPLPSVPVTAGESPPLGVTNESATPDNPDPEGNTFADWSMSPAEQQAEWIALSRRRRSSSSGVIIVCYLLLLLLGAVLAFRAGLMEPPTEPLVPPQSEVPGLEQETAP